ncbi:MAG: hypothetical protein U0457_19115 [Candidatus Sericytochromatia bacterium]
MYKKSIKLIIAFLSVVTTLTACNNQNYIDSKIDESSILANKKIKKESSSFIKPENIPIEIKNLTKKEAQEMSDKESKRRGVEFFDIPDNPIGLKLTYDNKDAYILSYIGTPKTTDAVNVEIKALYSENSKAYSLNYSGPLTNTEKFKVKKEIPLKLSKKSTGIEFELIQGLPPELLLRSFEDFTENLKNTLKMVYRPQKTTISEDDVFIYAIHNNGELQGFFFESHANKVVLGERKYADMQIGVFINNQGEILSNYTLVAFNPKVKVNSKPNYTYFSENNINFVQMGEL